MYTASPMGFLRANETNYNKCPCVFRIELEFGSVGFCGVGKGGEPGENPLRVRKERTNNKLYPHRTLCKSAAEELNLELPGTNPYSWSSRDLNSGSPAFKSGAPNHSATLPPWIEWVTMRTTKTMIMIPILRMWGQNRQQLKTVLNNLTSASRYLCLGTQHWQRKNTTTEVLHCQVLP